MFRPLVFRSGRWDFERPYVAGVVNVTPDSFSDGGHYQSIDAAVRQAEKLVRDGADLIDVGGESTRPGAEPIDARTEIERVIPVIARLDLAVPISIDTTKAEVAAAALEAGAEVINDVSGGRFDDAMGEVALGAAAFVCGHLRGTSIEEVHLREAESPGFGQVLDELARAIAGLPTDVRQRTIADPGLGFGKGPAQNLELCKRAGELAIGLQCPVMVGASRKRFVAALSGTGDLSARDAGTVGASLAAIQGGAHIVRVHNVAMTAPAVRLYSAISGGQT